MIRLLSKLKDEQLLRSNPKWIYEGVRLKSLNQMRDLQSHFTETGTFTQTYARTYIHTYLYYSCVCMISTKSVILFVKLSESDWYLLEVCNPWTDSISSENTWKYHKQWQLNKEKTQCLASDWESNYVAFCMLDFLPRTKRLTHYISLLNNRLLVLTDRICCGKTLEERILLDILTMNSFAGISGQTERITWVERR